MTIAGMTEQDFAKGPFWATLALMHRSQPVIISISELLEPVDYDTCSARFGKYFQFIVLNPGALLAFQ
jgi:hypothetical protein